MPDSVKGEGALTYTNVVKPRPTRVSAPYLFPHVNLRAPGALTRASTVSTVRRYAGNRASFPAQY